MSVRVCSVFACCAFIVLHLYMSTTVLVRVGVYSRVVTLADGSPSHTELCEAVCATFSDLQLEGKRLHVQVKSKEWGGEFVDLQQGQTLMNHSVLNVIPQAQQVKFIFISSENWMV